MYIHRQILLAVSQLGKEINPPLSQTELASQMSLAIHEMLEFNADGFENYLAELQQKSTHPEN